MTTDSAPARTVTTIQDAAGIYREAVEVRNLWMGEDDPGIQLFRGEVVENDSPGSGRPDDTSILPFMALEGDLVLRKVLGLADARADGAQLAFLARELVGHQATLRFAVNGHEVLRPPSPIAAPEARQYQWASEGNWNSSRWYYVAIPPECLQTGDNEITLQIVDGHAGWELMAADYREFWKGMLDPVELPHTSWRSDDGGHTWAQERGEYVVRLVLERFRARGTVVGPVVDAAGQSDGEIRRARRVADVRLSWLSGTPDSTRIDLSVRTGAEPIAATDGWSDWAPCQPGAALAGVRGRYVQWKAELGTEDPAHTPTLESVTIEANCSGDASMPPLRLVSTRNPHIQRSSFGFADENYNCDVLQELRRRFELDAVVAGAQTEFEKIEKLMAWAYYVPLGECVLFPWDVLNWLQLERDEAGAIRMNTYEQRRRDAMCLFPNVVLVAACLSMGIPARHVNFHSEGMTGHEIAEVWSNDYGKWVHLDATRDYYWYNPSTCVPLDTQEIHQALADRLERVERWDRPYLFQQDLEELVRDLPIAFTEGCHAFSTEEGAHFLFRSFCHFRAVPRLDVFSQPRPLPTSQGTEVWSWNGYVNWADDKVPPLPHFTHHTNRRADFYPTFNQTRYTLERTDASLVLQVYLETRTPGFDCFLARIDGETWRESPDRFTWTLHSGLNLLELRTRNRAGVEGMISAAAVEA